MDSLCGKCSLLFEPALLLIIQTRTFFVECYVRCSTSKKLRCFIVYIPDEFHFVYFYPSTIPPWITVLISYAINGIINFKLYFNVSNGVKYRAVLGAF